MWSLGCCWVWIVAAGGVEGEPTGGRGAVEVVNGILMDGAPDFIGRYM